MATNSETRERQMDELSALMAIFGSDLKDLKQSLLNGNDCGDRWAPLEVLITLKPMISMSELNGEAYVQTDLYVKCGQRYPSVIPEDICLKNTKGLSKSVCQQIRDELYEMAKRLRGQELIFAFAEHVRQCLHSHNKPPIQSFYDQMISHKTKLEIQKNEEIVKTNRRRDELIRKQLEEEMRRKESRLRRDSEREDIGDSLVTNTSTELRCDINHDLSSITFDMNGSQRSIKKAKCILHNHFKHSVDYLATDLSNGQTFVISEWILKLNDDTIVDDITDRISKVETIFKSKLMSLNDCNLIRYLSVQYSIKSDYIIVDLLQDHLNASSLYSLSNVLRHGKHPFNTSLVRYYSKQILQIINYLHANNCPHGDLRPTNVFVDSVSGIVKISGFYLEKQLLDIYNDINFNDRNSNSFSPNINRLKMKDIYDFGLLVFAISNDWDFSDKTAINLKFKINQNNISEELKHFLDKCIDSEESARWTAEQLLNHSFLSSQKSKLIANHQKFDDSQSLPFPNGRSEQTEDIKNNETNIQTKALLNSIVSTSMNSRLNEFEVLAELGKGGFGYVYKVKNLLDGRCYALKKISINQSNHSLYEKIRREVNLLSRLNHENIVRYYTSWIETENDTDFDSSEQSSSTKTSDNITQKSVKVDTKSVDKKERQQANDSSDSSDSDSDSSSIEYVDFEAEEDIFGTSFLVLPPKLSNTSLDDQYVVFERSGCDSTVSQEKTENINNNNSSEDIRIRLPRHYMFIQMELCEKSTLRDAIDGGLYNETQRKKRLYREIIEGLVHIHEQGMIHRDLKPGNIFLDLNDHVKIGDFGLAKEIYFIKDDKPVSSTVETQLNATQETDHHFRLTGKIGTPFYVAPELAVSSDVNSTKIYYTQKVDIYSLGIIFFEMSYPFQTLMERTKVVMNLRKKDIQLPIDVNHRFTDIEINILKSLLQHDYTLRPSSAELLASDYLPAPEMEEKEEQNVIRRAVQNTRTKIHKYMLNMLFQKDMSEIEDYVFDVNDPQFGSKSDLLSFSTKQRVFQYVYNVLETIMQSHCAVYVSVPTFLPKHSTQTYQTNDVFSVSDNTGSIVSLSHDLRVPFARYIARNNIPHLRRYSIEKVYRQRRVMGYHPKELWECAFDIVTPKTTATTTGCTHIMPDSEVLSVLSHVVSQFPALNASKLVLRINHINLIKAILDYCDIADETHNKIIRLLSECFSPKATQSILKESNDSTFASNSSLALKIFLQKKTDLEKYIDESKINSFVQILDTEQESVKKLLSNIKTHMRKKGLKQQNALQMAKHAIKELDLILNCAEKLGNLSKFVIKISPAFVMSGSSCVLYSGIIFQLEREVKHKKSTQRSIIAVGGRYDQLIASFDTLSKNSDKLLTSKGGVGLSIEFEKIMKCVIEEEIKIKSTFGSIIDVVVCSLTNEKSDFILKELCYVTKELSNSGLKVFCFPEDLPKNIDDLHAFCKDNSVHYAVALKEMVDIQSNLRQMNAKLFAYEKERYIDKKGGTVSEIVEYVIRTIRESLKSDNSSNSSHCDQLAITRSDSNRVLNNQFMHTNDTQTSAIASNIKVTFFGERLQPSLRKRHEKDIISYLSTALNFVMNNIIIEVFAVDIPFLIIKTICAEIELNVDNENESKNTNEKCVQSIIDKHQRYRKQILQITDAIYEFKADKKCPIICIISIADNMKFKLLN